jgi:carbon monoxide dehydrogenase subunit G
MRVHGSATVAAPLLRVWDALTDPAVLVRTIPGCRSLEATGDDTYNMTITAGVASIKGTYVGQVALSDPEPPHRLVLRARGQGAPGTIEATVRVRLSEGDGAGATQVHYEADAVVGGMIGGVGQRMLGSVAKRTAGEFFAAVERALVPSEPFPGPASALPRPEEPPPPAADPAPVYTAPRPADQIAVPMAVAFGTGGVVALAGVGLGYLMGRRARGRA